MTNLPPDGVSRRFEVHASSDSHFAWLRTRLGLDRTLLAWVRTATALIGFGFTIVQFFERFGSMEGVAPPLNPGAPRYVGLALIAAGIFSLAIAVWQYRRGVRYLWSVPFRSLAGMSLLGTEDEETWAPALALAVFLMVVGIVSFVAIAIRVV